MTTHRAISVPSVRPTRSRVRVVLALTALLAMVGSIGIGTSIPAYANDPACGPLVGGIHQVSTVAHLRAVGSGGTGTGECGLGADYEQVSDIDASGESSWTGIGTSTAPFTGQYDGNFNQISGGQEWGSSFLGFFAYVGATGTVSGLGVVNIRVNDPQNRGFRGLLVGQNLGTVSNSFATGSISVGGSFIGGLAGTNQGTVSSSFASVTISGNDYVGGLVGQNSGGTIENSYAIGSLSGSLTVGGLVGLSNGSISQAYAAATVSPSATTPGGLVGVGQATDSYYDQTVSGQSDTVGTAQSSAGMRTASTYTGWPLVEETTPDGTSSETWGIHPSLNSGYPFLWWQEQSAFCPIPEGSVRPIRTAQQLASVGSGGVAGPCSLSESYELKNDIDLSGFGNWYPIGVRNGSDMSLAFTGTFIGGGHGISFLALNSRDADFQGLFGGIGSAGTLSGVELNSPSVSANDYVGALAGWSEGTITQSEVSGSGSVTGDNWVGGLAGQIGGSSALLSRSFSTINAVGRSGSARIGGLAGALEAAGAEITDSYATGKASGGSQVGGLVGSVTGGTIHNSYSTATVSGSLNTNGLVGRVPSDSSTYTITNSFYDVDLSAGASGPADQRRTAVQLRDIDNFVGWDIAQTESPTGPSSQIWGISETKNSGYPFLWWSDYEYFCQPVEPTRVITGQPISLTNPYRVLTPGHLAWIAGENLQLVASGGTVRAADADTTSRIANRMSFVYRQDIDINLGNCGLLPIGLVLSHHSTPLEYPFSGSYDGNSHEITGLNVVGGSSGFLSGVTSHLGFFGRLDGEVKNLTITGATLDATTGNTITHAGILAGEAWTGAKIADVSVDGTLFRVKDFAGGLIGQVRKVGSGTDQTSLVRCSAEVVIDAQTAADGFQLGGLVGSLDEIPNTITLNTSTQLYEVDESFTEIDDCSVTAEIRATDHRGYIGGMVGRVVSGGIDQTSQRPSTGRVMITDSISTGEIILTALGGSSSYVGGAVGLGSPVMLDVELQDVTITTTGTPEYAGGLVGQLESRGLVDDSFVTGTITTAGAGSGSVGGLVGTMSPDSDLEDSSATMTINASLSDGDLTIGGLIGFQDDDANVRTSYSSGNLGVSDPRGATTSVGGMTGRLGDGGTLQNSWTDVNVVIDSFDGTSRAAYVGGLVGDMDAPDAEITNSYATGNPAVQGATQNLYLGEFLGRRTVDGNNTAGTITGGIHRNSNVSLDSVGNGSATGITEATEAQMEDRAFFVGRGWQIVAASTNNLPDGSSSEVWGIVDGAPCSPFLSWQASSKVQSCLVPVSSSGTTSSSAPVVAPLPPAVAPGRATPLGSADGVTEESNIQSPPSSSAESESDPQEIVTSAQGTSPLESDGGVIGWLAVLAIAGLGGVVLLGGGLAWWGARIR